MASSVTDRVSGYTSHPGWKSACKLASTGNLTLYGSTQTIDGITAAADYRILVKDQTTATENGIYLVDSSTWARDKDFDGSRDSIPGTIVYVDRGTVNGDTFWTLNSSSTATSVTIGTDNLAWTQVTVSLTGFSSTAYLAATSTTYVATTSTGYISSTHITAIGDVIVGAAGGVPSRLPIGTTGFVFTSSGGTAAWLELPGIVQRAVGSTVAVFSGGVAIPYDDTVPTSSEGILVIEAAITPTNATNIIRLTGAVNVTSTAGNEVILSAFSDSSTLAIAVSWVAAAQTGALLSLFHEVSAGSTLSRTYSLRCGNDTTALVIINGNVTGSRVFGGVSRAILIADEFTA